MKKFFYNLLLLSSFAGTSQVVTIPDQVFKQALLLSNSTNQQVAYDFQGNPMVVDVNQDGEIQTTEALAVFGLDLAGNENGLFLIEGNPITDLTGLEAFLNLKNLDISTNQLTGQTLNATLFSNLESLKTQNSGLIAVIVNNLTSLRKLDVTGNLLTEINLNGLINLEELIINSNQISTIDFSQTSSLVKLNASSNPLTTLNWSQLTQLTDLDLSQCREIQSVDVSSLINLRTLNVSLTEITSLDVSNNLLLTKLDCSKDAVSQASISTLDVSPLINLKELICSGNQLNGLNVSGLTSLEYLQFIGCNVATPIFGNNNNLTTIECTSNQITALDLSIFPQLISLYCANNNLSTLDFSTLPNLNAVSCSLNQFQSLDFSNNPNITYLDLGTNNELQYLNIKNNSSMFFGFVFDSELNLPNLIFICADDDEIQFIESFLLQSIEQQIVVNSYCSFVPGGSYNTISGSVTFDSNQNGCSLEDIVQPYIKVTINDGTNQGSVFTDLDGNFKFYAQEGNFTVNATIENNSLFTINGQNTQVSFLNNENNTAIVPFCIQALDNQSDLEVIVSPFSYPIPGSENLYQIFYKNKGNQTLSGNINFNYDTSKATFLFSEPVQNAINQAGELEYSFNNLLPFESRTIIVSLNLNGPTSQNPLTVGDILEFTATASINSTDINPSNNQFTYNQIIEEFMLLNSIICVEGEEVSADLIGDYLHYSINFENNTNQTSSFIVLRATINPQQFDINSIQLLASSSNVEVRITGNLLELIFGNLELQTGGHGNVLLRIKSSNQLQVNDTVRFETAVFFNETEATQTNTAETTFRLAGNLNNDNFEKTSILIYPNPTKSIVSITSDFSIKSIQLYDVQGRILQTNIVEENSASLDITSKAKGIYFLKVITDKGIKVEKLVKE
ncbi:DUF7619 domain-containing protein [Flavobacterium dankookense]|uniref:Putative secreted protein (Por secretion system target) n=1 Tax=Flavobacterium dankookense TaxID=706186 RepID=A0A4R6Q968_9FLAO|nr:T9SS type A sorting domain-containing protein [Flavobacterium dankookense]TDP59164.1 putative secreted protein (Por secretion system target) [Flavobacterium dankookense]